MTKQKNEIQEETKQIIGIANENGALAPLEETPLIADDTIVKYYEEAIQCIREDRDEAQDKYSTFCDMVLNEGDPSNSSKEALVNLLKIKTDSVGQMIKILDLWTRMKMKEKATSSQVYAYQQNNKYEVASNEPDSRIKQLLKMAKQIEGEKND